MTLTLSDELRSYLEKWFNTSTANQTRRGVEVRLTLEQFHELIGPKRAASLQRAIDQNRLAGQMHEENPYAYVLTWASYNARSTNVFDETTAIVCTRLESSRRKLPQKGDTLRASHRQALSKKLSGRTLSQDHKDNISKGRSGQPGRVWTQEQKDAASERRRAVEAAKKSTDNGARETR
jgi:hypothetical protein